MTKKTKPARDAQSLVLQGQNVLSARAAQRGLADERSMERTVATFNALTAQDLTTHQGWLFMVALKLVRGTAGSPQPDDYVDALNYVALAGEEALK